MADRQPRVTFVQHVSHLSAPVRIPHPQGENTDTPTPTLTLTPTTTLTPTATNTGFPPSGPVTIDYVYDPLNRLTEANYSNNDYYHYTYDAVGNR